jgi:NADH-quinone oxidoreductase subunit K
MILIDQAKYLTIATIIFFIGISGIFLNRKNLIIMLMSIELMLLGVNLNWIIFSVFLDDIMGQVMSLFILTVAAAESAIGLGILVVYYRIKQTIAVEYISLMKG